MAKIKKLGKFIVIEGIDGSGKSTQAKLLVGELGRRGIEVELTAEHTGGPAGRLIEEVVRRRQKLDSLALQLQDQMRSRSGLPRRLIRSLLGNFVDLDRGSFKNPFFFIWAFHPVIF